MTTQPPDELLDKIEEIATLKGELSNMERLETERFDLYVSSNVLRDGGAEIKAGPLSSVFTKLIFLVDSRGRRRVEKYHPGEWETTVDATLDITRALSRAANWTVPDEKAEAYHADEAANWDDPKWREARKALTEALAEHRREIQSALEKTDETLNMTIERVFFSLLSDEWPVERLELLSHRSGDVVAVQNLRDSYAAGYAVGKGWLSSEHLDNLLIDFADQIVRLIREMADKTSRRYPFVEAFRKVAALGIAAAEEGIEICVEDEGEAVPSAPEGEVGERKAHGGQRLPDERWKARVEERKRRHSQIYCSECGAEVPDSAKYCPDCGSRIERRVAPTEADVTVWGAHYAGFWQRFWARLLDGVILGVIAAVVLGATGAVAAAAREDEPDLAWGFFYVGIAFVYLASFSYYWICTASGATIGMETLGISVVRDKDGKAPGWAIGLGRLLVQGFLGGLLALTVIGWLLMYLWMIWDRKHQTWYDKAVGTIVVQRE